MVQRPLHHAPEWTRIQRVITAAVVALALALVGCPDDKKRIGDACSTNSSCASGLCAGGQCLAPDGDEDGDGLTNAFEATVGSDPLSADSDGDGVPDGDEVGAGNALTDSDGDGVPDLLESLVLDEDGDCLPKQLDAQDDVPDSDLSALIPTVCLTAGICADQTDALAVTCPAGGDPVCVYDGVQGYASPEAACDGVDEDCDGVVDGPWDGTCAVAVKPWTATSSGGAQVETSQHRAILTIGTAPLGAVQTDKHRALIGANPQETP